MLEGPLSRISSSSSSSKKSKKKKKKNRNRETAKPGAHDEENARLLSKELSCFFTALSFVCRLLAKKGVQEADTATAVTLFSLALFYDEDNVLARVNRLLLRVDRSEQTDAVLDWSWSLQLESKLSLQQPLALHICQS